MTEKIELTINGRLIAAEKGMNVLEASLRNNIYIPHLCFHAELQPAGACRLCLVEIDGNRTAIACKTPVEDGMVVRTETPEISETRKVALELLVADHDTDCLACAQNTKCALQRVADHVGMDLRRLERLKFREEEGGELCVTDR